MTQKTYRIKFMFWLDAAKADEDRLIEQIEVLKGQRLYSRTIRDGIRLICDLRAGRSDVLFELFPWVKDGLQAAPAVSADERIHAQIARLESLLLAQGNLPIESPMAGVGVDQALPRTVLRSSKPLVKLTGSAGKASAETVAKNFLSSMKGLASGFFD